MVLRPLLRSRTVAPAAAVLAAGGTMLLRPNAYAYADEPPIAPALRDRKPIYDDPPANSHLDITNPSSSPSPTAPTDTLTDSSPSSRPTPTDRLAAHIARTRLTLHTYATRADAALDTALTRFFGLEASVTHTIASLAPSPSSVERQQLLPGLIYMLVAGMAGTIAARRRGVLVRVAVPWAAAIGTGYVVLPMTMRNVGGLVWSVEERVPAVRDAHLRVSEEVTRVWDTGRAHAGMTAARVEDGVKGVKEAVEEWVKKGK